MTEKRLDRTQIKGIAAAAMLADHFAMFFLSPARRPEWVWLYALLRVIGRLTGPTMLFFLAEGYAHASSRLRYGCRLLSFGLISQIPYALAHENRVAVLGFNVILTLFVSFLMLCVCERVKRRESAWLLVFAFSLMTLRFDWGVVGPLTVWLFYTNRDSRDRQYKAYAAVCLLQAAGACLALVLAGEHWYGELWQLGMFLVIPLLSLYNGKAGKRSAWRKWFFYIFYPAHLLLIWLALDVI